MKGRWSILGLISLNRCKGMGFRCRGGGRDAWERGMDIYPGNWREARPCGRNVWEFFFDCIYFFMKKKSHGKRGRRSKGGGY